ncbi:helix-turn-helix transcriptional regulator [Actinomadura meyerae]|jgi:DNA-binding PadR family transcriptional regulator|nr:helix-turn-helix transcriptional regulator [Actinomadura meyerae]
MTLQTLLVLKEMLADPDREHFGLELSRQTGQPTGTIYPIIVRLERCGWVESSWEPPERHLGEGRRRRRYYKLTSEGAQQARAAIAKAERSRGTSWRPRTEGSLP